MDQATTLLALQEADLGIVRAERELDELPEKKAILEIRKKARDVDGLLAKARAFSDEVSRAISRLEDETTTLDEKTAREQARLTSGEVTDHREVQNLTREMDALRRRKEKLEMEELALMEKGEKAAGQLMTISAAIDKLGSDEQEMVERFKRAGGALLGRIEQLKAERAALAGALDAGTLSAYEAAREAKHGIGAALLDAGVCGACRVELPADKLHALTDGPDIAVCPNCRRLLVVRVAACDEAE